MTISEKIVLSASRRTDIPAFYMEWMMQRIACGAFEITNPFNQRTSILKATPSQVHTIVFWSKNFEPFIRGGYGRKLARAGYHLFFNFTINSESALLEPNVPPLSERLSQLEILCHEFGPRSMTWRFDPICFYRRDQQSPSNNLKDFSEIAEKASRLGVQRCVTSFMDCYSKIKKRTASMPGFSFLNPTLDTKSHILTNMARDLRKRNMHLSVCCEKDVIDKMKKNSGVKKASCIPNDLIMDIHGGIISVKPDRGQRKAQGCGCMKSFDIGSYRHHPCFHNCLFCYANPVAGPIRPVASSMRIQ